ncbi:thioredoxin domain-containing protein [Spirosoma gilvum]
MVPPSSTFPALPQHPILLVCTATSASQRPEVDRLVVKLRSLIKPTIQIMYIDDVTHPEVVRSFGFTTLPAFVLLQQGFELWRYAGPIDNSSLSLQLSQQLIVHS